MAAVLAAVGTHGGDVISYGSAHPGHAPAAALPCKPRAAPAGAGWRPAQDHFVIASATGFTHPGHSGPPGAIALVSLPGEQVPGHAARQLDQWRRPWRLVPRHEPSMRNYVRFMCSGPATCAHLVAVSRRRDPLLAKVVAATAGPAAVQVTSSAGCSVLQGETQSIRHVRAADRPNHRRSLAHQGQRHLRGEDAGSHQP
jgi:hypothetical protein